MTTKRARADRLVASSLVALLAACSGSVPATSAPLPTAPPFSSVDRIACGYPLVAAAPDASTAAPPNVSPALPHQAPALEGLLPSTVGSDTLRRWSVRGETLLALVASVGHPGEAAAARREFAASNVKPDDFGFAMAGADSGCEMLAVFALPAALLPEAGGRWQSLYDSLLRAIEVLGDLSVRIDRTYFAPQTIGGKRAAVGKPNMVGTADGGNVRHYLYQKGPPGRELFVALASDEAWVANAFRQLP